MWEWLEGGILGESLRQSDELREEGQGEYHSGASTVISGIPSSLSRS